MPAGVGGWPAGQPGQQEGRDLRVQELLGHEGHLKPLALEAGEVVHRRRVPGSGLLHGHWEGQRGGGALSTSSLVLTGSRPTRVNLKTQR